MMRLLLVASLLAACGDGAGDRDAGVPTDARFFADARVQRCSEDMNECDQLAFETRCDFADARCVECVTSDDCAMPPSLGPICNAQRKTCECASDDDCAANEYGEFCHPVVKACGCVTDDECSGARECKLEPYLGTGIRTCQQ